MDLEGFCRRTQRAVLAACRRATIVFVDEGRVSFVRDNSEGPQWLGVGEWDSRSRLVVVEMGQGARNRRPGGVVT